jgi:hypothetical protein
VEIVVSSPGRVLNLALGVDGPFAPIRAFVNLGTKILGGVATAASR